MKTLFSMILFMLLLTSTLTLAFNIKQAKEEPENITDYVETGSLTFGFTDIILCEDGKMLYWNNVFDYYVIKPEPKPIGEVTCTQDEPYTDPYTNKTVYKKLHVTITNGYPEYVAECTYTLDNGGTVPLNVSMYCIWPETAPGIEPLTYYWEDSDGDGYLDVAVGHNAAGEDVINIWCEPLFLGQYIGIPIDPCHSVTQKVIIHIKEPALLCHTYAFKLIIHAYALWNETYLHDEAGVDGTVNTGTGEIPRVHGIDVSHHQGDIVWSEVYGAGYRFAFAKASEGVGWVDSKFQTNMDEGSGAGLLMGAYHFARPDLGNDAADEAMYFISVAADYLTEGYLRPALDLEVGSSLGKEALSNWVHTWMETVKTETGIEPIIYVNSDYANNHLDPSVAEYDLWIAQWTYDPTSSPDTGIWDTWDFWQYSDQGSVPGISGDVDLDIFNGDMQRLHDTFVIPPPPQADLSVSIGWISNTSPLEGEPVTINVTVTNIGNAESGLSFVRLRQHVLYMQPISYEQDILLEEYRNEKMAPGESRDFTFVWKAVEILNDEQKPLYMHVLANDANQANNVAYVDLSVQDTSPFNVTKHGFSFSNSDLEVNYEDVKRELYYLLVGVGYRYESLEIMLAKPEEGLCHGIVSTSISYYKQDKEVFSMLQDDVLSQIIRAQAYHWLVTAEFHIKRTMDLRKEYEEIVKNLQRDQPLNIWMLLGDNQIHSVAVFNTFSVSEDIKNIIVYDPNYPGMGVVLTFDLENNVVSGPSVLFPNGIERVSVYVPYGLKIEDAKEKVINFFRSLRERILIFKCPVDVTITDEYGRVLSEMENQIPGAFFEYRNFTKAKIFYLPLNLTYNIRVNATDYGNITISQITPLESIYETAFSQATFNLTSETTAEFDLLPYDANYTLKVDENGDGLIDYELTLEVETLTTEYDIGITETVPSKTVVGQGYNLPINITIMNYGAHTETFNVTVYANTTVIATFTNITLCSGNSTTITFAWNTTGFAKGNYTISAYAWPVPGETDTADNTLFDGWVIVAMVGDITGPNGYPDGKCDIRDVAMVAILFGVNYPDPRYNPNCDFNNDGKIDIRDVALVAINFGKIDP